MTDVEKVIKGLESCPHITRDCPQDCPYERMAFCLAHLHHDALELLKEQPKWIPVSEKLPKKPDGYPKCELRRMYFLVSLESGCVESLGFDFDNNRWHTTGSPVIAWMKLPEPYTEGR